MLQIITATVFGSVFLASAAMADKLDTRTVTEAFPVEAALDQPLDFAAENKICEESPYGDDAWGSDPALAACSH